MFAHRPAEEGEVQVHGEEINANDLLPDVDEYYHYQASFTTPPCTEGVQWYLAQETMEASAAQIGQLEEIFANSGFSNEGSITPMEAHTLSSVMENYRKIIETTDLEQRITDLEKRRGEK